MPERERAQERAQRRGRRDAVTEHLRRFAPTAARRSPRCSPLRAPSPRASSSSCDPDSRRPDARRDRRARRLSCSIPRRGRQQRRQHHAGVGDHPLLIKRDHRSVRQTVHHAGDLLVQARRRPNRQLSACSGGHFTATPGQTRPPKRGSSLNQTPPGDGRRARDYRRSGPPYGRASATTAARPHPSLPAQGLTIRYPLDRFTSRQLLRQSVESGIYKFGASDTEGLPLRPNALFWTAIQASCARSDREFDFGRRPTSATSGCGGSRRAGAASSARSSTRPWRRARRKAERAGLRGPRPS